MKKICLKGVSLLMMSVLVMPTYAKVPDNLSCVKQAIIKYYESHEYEKDVNQIVKKAQQYLERRTQENNRSLHPQKLAIVLDIDDTSLTNFPSYKAKDFQRTPNTLNASYCGYAPAVKPVLQLYKKAMKQGIAIFFISLRPDTVRAHTISNLESAGYHGWTGLFLPKENKTHQNAQHFKTLVRKTLTEQGYQIVLNIGDQDSDLLGGYAEQHAKIPNPLYSMNCVYC